MVENIRRSSPPSSMRSGKAGCCSSAKRECSLPTTNGALSGRRRILKPSRRPTNPSRTPSATIKSGSTPSKTAAGRRAISTTPGRFPRPRCWETWPSAPEKDWTGTPKSYAPTIAPKPISSSSTITARAGNCSRLLLDPEAIKLIRRGGGKCFGNYTASAGVGGDGGPAQVGQAGLAFGDVGAARRGGEAEAKGAPRLVEVSDRERRPGQDTQRHGAADSQTHGVRHHHVITPVVVRLHAGKGQRGVGRSRQVSAVEIPMIGERSAPVHRDTERRRGTGAISLALRLRRDDGRRQDRQEGLRAHHRAKAIGHDHVVRADIVRLDIA